MRPSLLAGLICVFGLPVAVGYAQVPACEIGDAGLIVNEANTLVVADQARQYIELLVVGCPGRGRYPGNDPDILGPDPLRLDLRGWIIDDNHGGSDFGGNQGLSAGHIRFSNSPVWSAVPVGSLILIYNRAGFPVGSFPDDPDDTSPPNNIYITALGDEVDDRPLFVKSTASGSYPDYQVGDEQPDLQPGFEASNPVSSWDVLFLDGGGDAVQTRRADGSFFHGIVWGDLGGGTLAPNNGAATPSAGQGANRSGVQALNAVIFLSHNNTNGVFLDNYRHGNNFTITTTQNSVTVTPGQPNNTTGDRNSALRSNFRRSLSAGPDQTLCGTQVEFEPDGVIGFWSPNEQWRFTASANPAAGIFNRWSYASGPGAANDPDNVSIADPENPSTSAIALAGPGRYRFRREMPDPDRLPTDPTLAFCSDAAEVEILFLGSPEASAGTDLQVTGLQAELLGEDLQGIEVFDPVWRFIAGSGPTGAPEPIISIDPERPAGAAQVQVFAAGSYRFELQIGADGCLATDTVDVSFVDVPAAPTDVVATAANASASVSFNPPADDGGSPILGFTAQSEPGGLTSLGCTASPCLVEGLTNGTVYTFSVFASNALGDGPLSAPSNSIVPATTPGAVSELTVSTEAGSALVSWAEPDDDGGSAILSYRIVAEPGEAVCLLDQAPLPLSCSFTTLPAGTYTFAVSAGNALGFGPELTSEPTAIVAAVVAEPIAVSVLNDRLWLLLLILLGLSGSLALRPAAHH